MDVLSHHESDEDLIGQAAAVVEKCNWIVGRCAAEWKSREDSRTDEKFGQLIGLGRSRVAQCRRVWQVFGERGECYGRNNEIPWHWWRERVGSPSAGDLLDWMIDNKASADEGAAWLRMQDGDAVVPDLRDEDEDELSDDPAVAPREAASVAAIEPMTSDSIHDPAEDRPQKADRAPAGAFGVDDPNKDRTRLAPDSDEDDENERKAIERCLAAIATKCREAMNIKDGRYQYLLADGLDALADDARRGDEPQGLDKQTIRDSITSIREAA